MVWLTEKGCKISAESLRSCKLLIELKSEQSYSISLTLRFCNKTTQLSLSLFLKLMFVKGGLNTFATHQTIA